MPDLIVRRAAENDIPALTVLIDGFAKGHPAEHYSRSAERMREALFGSQAVAQVLLAERHATPIGLALGGKPTMCSGRCLAVMGSGST